MEPPKGFSDRVQRWMGHIPGVRTYEDRENRRETDKRLREHLAGRLQEARSELNRLALELGNRGELGPLSDIDRFSSHIQQIADTIRYASYGFGGIFDLPKIREGELDRLYICDLGLLEDVEEVHAFAAAVRRAPPENRLDQIRAAQEYLDGLEEKFRSRTDFLNRAQPTPASS
jgi:hypothetical protein